MPGRGLCCIQEAMWICLGTSENGQDTMESLFYDVTLGGVSGVDYCAK